MYVARFYLTEELHCTILAHTVDEVGQNKV